MAQPYRVRVVRGDQTTVYVLRSKVVTLSGGKQQTICFFAREPEPTDTTQGETITPNVKFDRLVWVARALMTLEGMTPAQAAAAVTNLKGDLTMLTDSQAKELAGRIQKELES